MTVGRPSAADLLNLSGISRRDETIRFDLLDQGLNVIGQLAVDGRFVPEIVNDVTQDIRRVLNNFQLIPRKMVDTYSALIYAEEVDIIANRVRPVWVLQGGGTGYEFPLGVFLWGDDSREQHSWGVEQKCTLVDQCLILNQPLAQSVSYAAGTVITTALAAQAAAVGIAAPSIDVSSATLSAPATWVAGRDTTLAVMESLCAGAGFYAPYFSNAGVLVCRAAPNLATASPTQSYAPGGRILADSILTSSDLLAAPNRYIVIDNSATNSSLVGTFDVPASAPHSFANRGFYVVKVIEIQGLTDQATANAAAQAAYAQDSSTYSWLSFSSTPDPRHDTFDVVAFQQLVGGAVVNYREQGWRLPLSAGSQMNHDLRGIYS